MADAWVEMGSMQKMNIYSSKMRVTRFLSIYASIYTYKMPYVLDLLKKVLN